MQDRKQRWDIFREEISKDLGATLITFDTTPTLNALTTFNKIRQTLLPLHHAIFRQPKIILSTNDLININEHTITPVGLQTIENLYEAAGSVFSYKRLNIMYSTPISAIAWSFFMLESGIITKERNKIDIAAYKSHLTIAGSRIKDVKCDHIIELYHSNSDAETTQTEAFNNCLIRAAKIGSECLQSDITLEDNITLSQ